MENERRVQQKAPASRYALLDELRGLDLISMMLFHVCWDLVFLFDMNMGWYAGTPGRLWQQSICWVFILLSGFCVPLGRHTLRRGTVVFGAGAVVTLATLVFIPEGRVIFGVLTFLGTAMLLTGVLEPVLKRIPPLVGLVASAVLFVLCSPVSSGRVGIGSWQVLLPQSLYVNYFTAFLAFIHSGSTPPITLACCRGCFCSGRGTTCTRRWAADAWNCCATRSARHWAGWGGTRFCCICCISR